MLLTASLSVEEWDQSGCPLSVAAIPAPLSAVHPGLLSATAGGTAGGTGCCFPAAAAVRYVFAQPQLAGTGMAVGLLRVLDKGKAIDPLSMYLDIVYFAYLFQVV